MKNITLDRLKISEKATIKNIESGVLAAKLTEMGLYPGKTIKVLFIAPFGGPIAIDVEGYILSLRMDEASKILIE